METEDMAGRGCRALLTLSASLLLLGCSPSAPTSPAPAKERVLRVAIASDLQFVMEELRRQFQQRHPDVRLEITSGSSGTLYSQLLQQAPFDLYLAADIAYAEKLEVQGLTSGPAFPYARGQLVLWTRRESSLDLEQPGLQVLVDSAVKKIAIANPEHAPYGRAAQSAIKAAGLETAVESRLVLGENVAQAAQFVVTGAADVGLIALSLARSPNLQEVGKWAPVSAELYPPLQQGGVLLKWAAEPSVARQFQEFLLGNAGREVLKAYGFQVPGE